MKRRQVLALFGTSAGAVVAATYAPWAGRRLVRRGRALLSVTSLASASAGTVPACVVRPEQTEGPYFVDERLNRSDIRPDPSDGSVSDGAPLTFAFVVSRIDGAACTPLEGALVDVWHCDAAGVYSDVQDPNADTTGRKFLRGYQLTDASGSATFVTIYPGWYPGRAVHIHFKIRTAPDSTAGFEFTSQLYFDDAFTDGVFTQAPYAAHGERTARNADDAIYQSGGDELLLAVGGDGVSGYTAAFAIGVALPSSTCATVTACLEILRGTLPDPASATARPARRTARTLQRRLAKAAKILGRAASGSGVLQTRRYARARDLLQALLATSADADRRGTLGTSLAAIEAAVAAVLALVP